MHLRLTSDVAGSPLALISMLPTQLQPTLSALMTGTCAVHAETSPRLGAPLILLLAKCGAGKLPLALKIGHESFEKKFILTFY